MGIPWSVIHVVNAQEVSIPGLSEGNAANVTSPQNVTNATGGIGDIFRGPFLSDLGSISYVVIGVVIFIIAVLVVLMVLRARGWAGGGALPRELSDADLIAFVEDSATRTISIVPMRRVGNVYVSTVPPYRRLLSFNNDDVLNFNGRPAIFAMDVRGYLFSTSPSRHQLLSLAMKGLGKASSIEGFGDLVSEIVQHQGEITGEIQSPSGESLLFSIDRNQALMQLLHEMYTNASIVFDGQTNLITAVERTAQSIEVAKGLASFFRGRTLFMMILGAGIVGLLLLVGYAMFVRGGG